MFRFIILAAPRTGSNMLASLLHSHSDILCHHELYNPRGIFYALNLRATDFNFKGFDMAIRDEKPLDFLDEIWKHDLGHSHIGFKMTHYQNPTVFDALLADEKILKIVLRRKNKIATHVSKLIAEQNDVWEYYGGQPLQKSINQVQVNWKDFQQDIDYNNRFYQDIDQRLAASNQTAFYLDYESILSKETQEELLAFLGCPWYELRTKSVKQNPAPLSQLISNYEEIMMKSAGLNLMKS